MFTTLGNLLIGCAAGFSVVTILTLLSFTLVKRCDRLMRRAWWRMVDGKR